MRSKSKTYLEFHLRQLEHEIASRVLDLGESHVSLGDGFEGRIVESNKVSQHSAGLVEGAISVVLAHTILLQEIVLQHPRDFQCDLLVLS